MAINNEPTIKPVTVTGIFTRYIAKTIPLAFDESMSYYECLCALLNYLNETIVPDINNVNNGLGELQNFYLELQNYVNTYFDNLDVQEEINNKLDEMVESGELQELINQFLELNTPLIIENKENLLNNSSLKNGSHVILNGLYSKNDLNNNLYEIVEKNENDKNIGKYNILISNNLIAKQLKKNILNPILCVNLWLDTDNLDRVKNRINTYITMGVSKLIIPLHMTGDNCTLKEDIDFVKSAIDYAISEGLIVDTLKFHCTDSRIDNNSTYQNYYKTNVLSTINTLKALYDIERVTILNERPAFYSRSASSDNVNFAINFVNDIKALDLECSITISQINKIIEMINYNYTLANTLSFLCANDYPSAGYNGKNTTINDTLDAFNNYEIRIKTIKNLMPTKKLFWSEVGIQDNYENYINPADWTFQNDYPSANGNTIPIYFYGLVNFDGINDVDEVWLWYTEYFIDFKNKLEIFKNTEWGV